jgi:hypothetical protein
MIAWGESWLKHHPGWTLKTWGEKNLPKLVNLNLFSKCSCLGQQADLVRYEVLLQEGGVYVDADVECVRNIEPLIEGCLFFALRRDPRVMDLRVESHSNAFFGSIFGHPIMRDLVQNLRRAFRPQPWTAIGPPYFSSILGGHPGKFLDLPSRIVLDLNKGERPKPGRRAVPGNVYAVNYHSSKWIPSSMESLRKNFSSFPRR